MRSSSRIPATVVTGFLGSGKTTMIRHMLANAGGRRLALIINEFGDLGIDREIIAGCGIEGCREDDVVELANGCICCTVADAFLPTMQRLIDRPDPPDHIVVETSGLALPKPLVKAFAWPEVRSRVTVDGVVAVIDAPAVLEGRFEPPPGAAPDHDTPLRELFEDQLAAADLVVMNKRDLLSAAEIDRVASLVRSGLRPGVKAVATEGGALDLAVLLGLDAAAEADIENRPSHHDLEEDHDHDDFESFVVDIGPVAEPERLEARLASAIAIHDVLRIKGFVDVPDKPMRHVVQAVGGRIQRYYDRPWKAGEERAGRLVVIGAHGLDRMAIKAAIVG